MSALAILALPGLAACGSGSSSGGSASTDDLSLSFCKSIADEQGTDDDSDDGKMTETEYREIRDKLQSAGLDPAIKEHGTKFIDLAWQISQMSDDDSLAALPLLGQVMSEYASLSGACASHGVMLKPLTMSS